MVDRRSVSWQEVAPRWFLVGMVVFLAAAAVYLEGSWRVRVTTHLDETPAALSRLAVVETKQNTMLEEFVEMRKDQLEFYKWQAAQLEDWPRFKAVERKLSELEAKFNVPSSTSPSISAKP